MLVLLCMVKGSESEGGTQMHSVKKIRDLLGQAEIMVNKQTTNRGHKPGNQIYHSTKTEG